MMLEYAKAVQESVYEQLRVVQEGQLQIIFTSDLKILSWEFCARRHEVLLTRRLVAPQVNQLQEIVQKYQHALTEMEPDGVSQQDLEANGDMVITTGRQLAESLELQSLNDLGFSKRYVRFLQLFEVVNSMKDLMEICMECKVGPIEGLTSIPRHGKAVNFETQYIQETEQRMGCIHGLPTDRNALDKLMSLHPGLNCRISNNQHMCGWGAISGSGQASLALSNFPVPGLSSTNLQLQQQRLLSSGSLPQNKSQSSQGSQVLQQQMIQQHLQDINTSSGVWSSTAVPCWTEWRL
ncbi:hypothetical protein P3S68_007686 [Capsicum galapagoense]